MGESVSPGDHRQSFKKQVKTVDFFKDTIYNTK